MPDPIFDPILSSILLATLVAGVFSITAAAIFSFSLLSKVVERMVRGSNRCGMWSLYVLKECRNLDRPSTPSKW